VSRDRPSQASNWASNALNVVDFETQDAAVWRLLEKSGSSDGRKSGLPD
jgi:hypothetical protein